MLLHLLRLDSCYFLWNWSCKLFAVIGDIFSKQSWIISVQPFICLFLKITYLRTNMRIIKWFTFWQLLDDTSSSYEQIGQRVFHPKYQRWWLRGKNNHRKRWWFISQMPNPFHWNTNSQKSVLEKGTQYKHATIMNKSTQIVNLITWNVISTHIMIYSRNCLESGKNDISKLGVTKIE